MRFPKLYNNEYGIDYILSESMIDRAITGGVNFFDLGMNYSSGPGEFFVGQVLQKYPRQSFVLAHKLPISHINLLSIEHADMILADQLKRCQVNYFDFYLLHGLNSLNYPTCERLNIYDWLCKKRDQGLIRYIGFSFHDTPEVMSNILDDHLWDLVQIQLNYIDWEVCRSCKSKELYAILAERKIPAVVMEPVRGGALADLGKEADSLLKKSAPNSSIASWAIRYAASLQNILTVLSGMSTLEQVEDNLKIMMNFEPLSDKEREILADAAAVFLSTGEIPCSGCGNCKICPNGVDIQTNFIVYNLRKWNTFSLYYRTIAENEKANNCTSCNECRKYCPKNIDIPTKLHEIAALYQDIKPSFFVQIYRLFCVIPFITIKKINEYKFKYYLFGFIPFLTLAKKYSPYPSSFQWLKEKLSKPRRYADSE
jgi:predicted aldo/keto reductase-like oxidoreductase